MLTSKAVIQKIDVHAGRVRLYQNFDLRSAWSFESSRSLSPEDSNPAIFPFVFHGRERFAEGTAGHETKVHAAGDNHILFADDYGVPAGIVIGVLFPEEYVPEVFKFKSKPYIPTGVGIDGTSMNPPGHFDVFFNARVKRSAVVFLITQPTYFGFKCSARKRATEFPSPGEFPFFSDLYATLGFEESHPVQVTSQDLMEFEGQFSESADLGELADAVTRLAAIARKGRRSDMAEASSLSKRIQDSLSTTASIVQLSDSYTMGGIVGKVIVRLITYLTL